MTSAVEEGGGGPSTWKGDILFTGVVSGVCALLVLRFVPELLDGHLVDTDSYMRLVRVRELAGSGGWFDHTIPRSNAPYGEVLHWTRPVDVLLLLGTWLGAPLLGFERALHLAGVLLSPVLLLAVCFAAAWTLRPLAGRGVRYYAMIAVLAQAGVMGYALPGRADHHMLILLAFVMMLGWAIRLVLGDAGRGAGWAAGAWAGFGLWVSTEFLVALFVLLVTLLGLWIVRGAGWAERGRAVSLGLLGVTVLGVAAEHPPDALLLAEYDRISAVHVLVAVLVVVFWSGASWRGVNARPGARAVFAVIGAGLSAGAVLALYPAFFRGPLANVDPELHRVWLPYLTEYQSYLVPRRASDLGRIVAYLGSALLAAVVVMRRLTRRPRSRSTAAFILLGLGLVVFLPLGFRWVRFVIYAEVLGVLGTVVLLAAVLRSLQRRGSELGLVVRRALASVGLLAGPLLLGAAVMALGGDVGAAREAAAATRTESCPVDAVVSTLNDPAGLGDRPRTVLAHVDLGPRLLYRTPHSVVATPYHRNARGILDGLSIMHATDPREARRGITERGVEVVVTCGFALSAGATGEGAPRPFVALLREGPAPTWMAPVGRPMSEGGAGVYEVLR